jgi:hypothetical protein
MAKAGPRSRLALVAVAASVMLIAACSDPLPSATPVAAGRLVVLDATAVRPPRQAARDPAAAIEAWQADRRIAFDDIGYDPWPVPGDPSWAEDPFDDAAWRFRYHSLTWLQAPAAAATAGDTGAASAIRALVLDWIRDNPRGAPADRRAWYDHAVALRTETLVWLAASRLLDGLDPPDREVVAAALADHGRVLRRYLDEPRFVGHNHGLFHALALFDLAVAMPDLPAAGEWRTRARERVSELLGEMVDPGEGVSTERSVAYHDVALGLFADALPFLARHGSAFAPEEVESLGRMARFGLLVGQPDGSRPAVGDTLYGSMHEDLGPYERVQAEVSDPVIAFLMSRGREGTRPPDLAAFPRTGWVVMRPGYGDGAAWVDDPHLVLRADPDAAIGAHGHHDAAGLTYFAAGRPWFVDAGGPFRYDDPRRAELVAARAHSTLVADDLARPAGPARLVETGDASGWTWAVVERSVAPQVVHRRTVVLLDDGRLLVVDAVEPDDAKPHDVAVLFHLAPEADVDLDPSGLGALLGVSGTPGRLELAASGAFDLVTIRGRTEPSLLGWVTPVHHTLMEAPVVVVSRSAPGPAWFVAVLRPLAGETAALAVTDGPAGLRIRLPGGSSFLIGPDGRPTSEAA